MFKSTFTAAALVLLAGFANAQSLPEIQHPGQEDQLGYYCEWATVYDYWGNWVTVYQCF